MTSIIFTVALAASCPSIKTNIFNWVKADHMALVEHQNRCRSTKSWPCVKTFEKKGPNWYVSECVEYTLDK